MTFNGTTERSNGTYATTTHQADETNGSATVNATSNADLKSTTEQDWSQNEDTRRKMSEVVAAFKRKRPQNKTEDAEAAMSKIQRNRTEDALTICSLPPDSGNCR